jgi:eukaryotic-like serine/threonine-protein kinase
VASLFAGRYELIRRLGTGGMAEVHLAKQQGASDFEKIVAIKTILPHLTGVTQVLELFVDEARIAAQLDHANIVRIYDFGKSADMPFIVMEYVHGTSLSELMRRCAQSGRTLPLDIALYVMRCVCRGLDYAHRKTAPDGAPLRIVHRDLDPRNILLSYEGEIKIGDFGIARAEVQRHQTTAGTIRGKMHYIAPETMGGGTVDQRADIYSLGVVFYEMIAGCRPIEEKETFQLYQRALKGDHVPLQKAVPSVPPGLDAAIEKALCADRDKRYRDVGELLQAVEKSIDQQLKKSGSHSLRRLLHELFPDEAASPVIGPGESAEKPELHAAPIPIRGEPARGIDGAGLGPEISGTEIVPAKKRQSLAIWLASALVAAVLGLLLSSVFIKRDGAQEISEISVRKAPATPSAPTPINEVGSAPETEALSEESQPPVKGDEKKPAAAPLEGQGAPPPAAARIGYISANADVGCDVTVDGKSVGVTPISLREASAGSHVVRFSNASLGLIKTFPVTVSAKKETKVSAAFLATLMANATPWADVYLDGTKIGVTPVVRKDILPGAHTIRLVNPEKGKTYEVTRNFESAQSVNVNKDFSE